MIKTHKTKGRFCDLKVQKMVTKEFKKTKELEIQKSCDF